MSQAAARRRGAARDEARHRFLAATLRFVDQELRRLFLGVAADFADHDDRLGRLVGKEQFEHVDEVGAVDGVAADADRGRLAKADVRGLEHRFIGQRARARDAADAALGEDRSEEQTSELQSHMSTPYAVFCLKKKYLTPHNNPTF